jgi:hypothetical protein
LDFIDNIEKVTSISFRKEIKTIPATIKRYTVLVGIMIVINAHLCFAGPPFGTDDPETVIFKHWEYYISSINMYQSGVWSGTLPHFELNYGLVPNVQVHLELPMNYDYARQRGFNYGYANTELGIKYRFIQETGRSPQIGTFPIIEIPTIRNNEFNNRKAKIMLPLWVQKSWGKLTTYGGAGYWINPGTNNKNWIFSGWEIQYDISTTLTLGGEVYYHSADAENNKSETGFNLGGFVNFTEKFHLIFSIGHSLTNDRLFNSYIGVLWTI